MDAMIIESEALRLPEAERALLADRLLQSLAPSEFQDEWIQEVESRMQAYEAGELAAVDGPEAIAALRARFAR
jgi:putative addiction module component (TIGR02574 family)